MKIVRLHVMPPVTRAISFALKKNASAPTSEESLLIATKHKLKNLTYLLGTEVNMNEYIRSCVERRAIAPVPPEVNRVTAVELGRIGINLNQLVRAMNTALASGQEISDVDVKEALSQVKEVDKAVKKIQLELLRP